MSGGSDAQREVTRIALVAVADAGFALADSGAIREHGVIDRPTEDVDLFTTTQDTAEFAGAVERVVADLRGAGYEVEEVRRAPHFARLGVRTGDGFQLDVDMGVDWRKNEPVRLDVGPVLSVEDAVGNKVSALYSRGEPRDYLDVDAIRRWGRFTDEELVSAAAERDAGFEPSVFAEQLESVRRVTPLMSSDMASASSSWRPLRRVACSGLRTYAGGQMVPKWSPRVWLSRSTHR